MEHNTGARKTRKAHRKSRNGCLPCKARHVKCDEQKPACVNCDKYHSKCEYPTQKRRALANGAPSPVGLSTPSSTGSVGANRPVPETLPSRDQDVLLNVPQLRLLHHFTTVTAKTLAAHSNAEEVFSSYLVKVAFDHPFLLHAILAVAALHLGRLERKSRADFLLQAEKHHDAALARFRSDVEDIHESNFEAVLAFATALFPYSCAISIDNSKDLDHAFDIILSNLLLTRRVRPMVSSMYGAMNESELGRIVPNDIQGIDFDAIPSETELVQLRKFSEAVHHIYPSDIVEAYGEAIRILEIVFSVTSRLPNPPSDALLKMWIHFVTPRFMELLSEKQPGALIIFAHYGVLLGRSQRYWFLEGVAEQILQIADAFVPTEWATWLDWPKEQIAGGQTYSPEET